MAKKYIATGKNKIMTSPKSKMFRKNYNEIKNNKIKKNLNKLFKNNFNIRIKKLHDATKQRDRPSSPNFYGFDLIAEKLKDPVQPHPPYIECHIDTPLIPVEEEVQNNDDQLVIDNSAKNETTFLNVNNTKYFYNILSTPAELECWTGIKNLEIFKNICNKMKEFEMENNLLMSKIDHIHLIPIEELLTLVMIRIRTNLNFLRMSTLFNMIEEELINKFELVLPIVRSILYTNNNWPSKRLGKSFGLVLEPFEFLLENNLRQIKEYSYQPVKVKAMVGFSESGKIIWSSDIYSETATYNDICMKEGIYDNLRRIDTVTVRKHIGVHHEFKKRGIFCYTDDKTPKKNVNKIREKILGEINSFEIFQKPISLSMLSYLDDILSIVCFSINIK